MSQYVKLGPIICLLFLEAGWLISCDLGKVSKLLRKAGFASLALGLGFSGLLLLVSTAGASSWLHQLIHSDAGSVEHQCVITLFQKGHVSSTAAPAVFAAPVLYGACDLLAETLTFAAFDYRFSSSRAPPALLSIPA